MRYIEDDEDDDAARFNNNLFSLGGRDNRASTKLIRMGDNQSDRSSSVYSNITQIQRIDTISSNFTQI